MDLLLAAVEVAVQGLAGEVFAVLVDQGRVGRQLHEDVPEQTILGVREVKVAELQHIGVVGLVPVLAWCSSRQDLRRCLGTRSFTVRSSGLLSRLPRYSVSRLLLRDRGSPSSRCERNRGLAAEGEPYGVLMLIYCKWYSILHRLDLWC